MSERISDLCLAKECKELEDLCGVVCTEKILMGEERWGREMKEIVRKVDHSRCLVRCHEKASVTKIGTPIFQYPAPRILGYSAPPFQFS